MPEGFPTYSSTLISGPGGTGKPLIGNAFAAAWLRTGGSVVFMPLQYPGREVVYRSLDTVNRLDVSEFQGRVAYINLDTTIGGIEGATDDGFKANLVLPGVWDEAIERARSMVPEEGPGVLVFGSALNLLLFSPTFGINVLEKMKATIRDDKRNTYIFSVSTTAKREAIAELEQEADNLFMVRSVNKPFRLLFRIIRLKDVAFSSDEVLVPIPEGALAEVKTVADRNRKRVNSQIAKI
jgi:KaiC/GvpD/RAD55 family RecA-like ATPase